MRGLAVLVQVNEAVDRCKNRNEVVELTLGFPSS